MIKKLKELLRKLNSTGFPVPMVMDPSTKSASVSLTMVVVSFGLCVIGLIGKSAGFLGGVNLSEALSLLQVSCVLYFGRRMSDSFLPAPIPQADPPQSTSVNISIDKQS